jgi:hypothetical protein
MRKLISIFILSSLAGISHANQAITVPELEGGFTASIGTFYAKPSSNNQNPSFPSGTIDLNSNNNQDNQFGTQGSIGYIFNNSPNGVELSNRSMH